MKKIEKNVPQINQSSGEQGGTEALSYPDLYQEHIKTIGDPSFRGNASWTMTQSIEQTNASEPTNTSQSQFSRPRVQNNLASTDGLFKRSNTRPVDGLSNQLAIDQTNNPYGYQNINNQVNNVVGQYPQGQVTNQQIGNIFQNQSAIDSQTSPYGYQSMPEQVSNLNRNPLSQVNPSISNHISIDQATNPYGYENMQMQINNNNVVPGVQSGPLPSQVDPNQNSDVRRSKKRKRRRNRGAAINKQRQPQYIQNSYGGSDSSLSGGLSEAVESQRSQNTLYEAQYGAQNNSIQTSDRVRNLIRQINTNLAKKKTTLDNPGSDLIGSNNPTGLLGDMDKTDRVKFKDKIRDRTDPARRDNQQKNIFKHKVRNKDIGSVASSDFTENYKNVPLGRNQKRFRKNFGI